MAAIKFFAAHFLMLCLILAGIMAIVSYVLIQIVSNGDDHWLWVPMVVLLPFIAVPLYFIMSVNRAREEKFWENKLREASMQKHEYNPRKLKTEADLIKNYQRAKAQKRLF